MLGYTNSIEREVISVASGKVEIFALELELVASDPHELVLGRGSGSGEGQQARDEQVRSRNEHLDGLATEIWSTLPRGNQGLLTPPWC
jgi:hypothetical protein